MITPRTPTILRIVWTDYYAMLAAILLFPLPALVIVFFLLPMALDPKLVIKFQDILAVLVGTGIWILIFGGALGLRISTIRSVFTDGQEIRGKISEVAFVRDRGLVKYSYVYMGAPYTSTNRIMKNGRTKQLAAGSEAPVMVDLGDPKRAFLRDIYM